MSNNEREESSDSKNDFAESIKFLLERVKDLKEPLCKADLDQEFLSKGGSLTSDFCWNKWSPGVHQFNKVDMDTKVKILFALSIPVNHNFLIELRKEARVALDDERRIRTYNKNGGGLWLNGKHKPGLLAEQFGQFHSVLRKKSITTVAQLSWTQTLEEFKTQTKSKENNNKLRDRFYHIYQEPFNSSKIPFESKTRLSFWTQSQLCDHFLKRLRGVGTVEIDEKQRIVHYRSNKKDLVMDRDNWYSTNDEEKMWKRIGDRVKGVILIEDPNHIQSLRFEKEMAEFIKFLKKRSENVTSPFGFDRISSRYNAITGSSISKRDATRRTNLFRDNTEKMKSLDTRTTIQIMFAWSIPVKPILLQELRKDAIVEVNSDNRITRYESNDGNFKLSGLHKSNAEAKEEEKQLNRLETQALKWCNEFSQESEKCAPPVVTKSGRVSQRRKHDSEYFYDQMSSVKSLPSKSIPPIKESVVSASTPKVSKPIASEPEETSEVAPATTKIAPPLSEIAPASVKVAPTTSNIDLPTSKIAPATTKIAPSLPEVAPPTTEIAPASVKVTLSRSLIAPTTMKVAPTSSMIASSSASTIKKEVKEADEKGIGSDKAQEKPNDKENGEESFRAPSIQKKNIIKIPTNLIKANVLNSGDKKRKIREDHLGSSEKMPRIEDEDQVTVSEGMDINGEARDEGNSEVSPLASQEVVEASSTPEATVSGPTEDPMTPAHPEEDQMEFEQNLELERTGPATSTPFNPTLYFDDDFENLMKTPDTSRGVPKGLDNFNLDLFNCSFSAEIGTINQSDYPLYLGNGITDEEAPESSTSQASFPEGSIPLGARRRLLESIQTLILYLDLPNFERIQKKIEMTLEKINEFSAPVEASEVKIAVDLCISIANRSETPSPDEDYRSLHNFLNFIRSSIIPMKLPQFETIIQTLNEKNLNQDRRISVDRIQLSLAPIIGVITC